MGHFIKLVLCAFLVIATISCKKNLDENCDEKPLEVENVNPEHQRMQPYSLGDSFSMRILNRERIDSSTYSYNSLGNINFSVIDSFGQENYSPWTNYGDCRDEFISIHQVVNFKGDSSLQVKLIPQQGGTVLNVIFDNKEFKKNSLAYNKGSSNYFKSVWQVNGKIYDDVNLFEGYEVGSSSLHQGYIDSTFMFYNSDVGIIRIVINDRLVFERE